MAAQLKMKYEYRIETIQLGVIMKETALGKAEKFLDELGAEGWELVGVSPNHTQMVLSGGTLSVTAFFKRQK